MAAADRPDHVFLNVPFDERYESLFITLVGTLVFLGQKPHCVLEIQEKGQGRLIRIFELMQKCRMSIHDLSRTGTPPRFNMPFELGLACSLSLSSGAHDIVVLDAQPYRIDRVLSDYKGRDPLIHYNRCDDMTACLIDLFDSSVVPPIEELRHAARALRASVGHIKREMKSDTVFRPSIFRSIVAASIVLAEQRGWLKS